MSISDSDADLDGLAEDDGNDAMANSSADVEESRPRKRRRIVVDEDEDDEPSSSPPVDTSSRTAQGDSFLDDEAIEDSAPEDDIDLPPLPHDRGSDNDGTESPQKKSKYKIHVNKYTYAQENTFVTQLTQPPSSPSRIRGPRWKKPTPRNNVVQRSPGGQAQPRPQPEPDEGFNAADIEAALSASRGSADSRRRDYAIPEPSHDRPRSSNGVQAEDSAAEFPELDMDDLPSDAFASSSVSPQTTHAQPVEVLSESPTNSHSRPNLPSKNMRQTTLFGGAARADPQPASQARVHNWPLSNKTEPPTHHKLDYESMSTWVYPTNLGKIRDYQFNIVQRGLFHNLLVALPTGLGKTFIAATIMLNWFRWTKEAQIVFVAPTKPLVSQQVEACFGIAGIPRHATTMLTGNVAPALRAEEWEKKRVFFMTPQTLQHDLTSGICDPKKIVLLVVDEAHRATGGYSYVEVVKFLRRFNTSFRVLALTATPGASVESVQEVIDGLDISRVEIRTEESLDIREYSHVRNIEQQIFEYTEEMTMAMDLFSKALQPVVNQLNKLNAFWGKDPMALTAYGLTMARKQWMGSAAAKNSNWGLKGMVNTIFNVLASLAHAIDLLKFHGIGPFYRNMLNFRSGLSDGEKEKGNKYQKQIVNDEHFKKVMNRMQAWMNDPEFVGHPKLSYLKSVVLNHFMDAGEGRGAAHGRPPSDTRIMIFVHYRDSAEEVARVLKRHEPMIRPHVFVGQAGSKGSEGMNQKTQLEIVEKFKKGTYNTIVATSIGEEGLDIGEVDLIVCYDSSASPIRMLQRMGRTGRKRAGNIVLLLMKGKEEDSYVKAKDNYEKMQQMIASGARFTFHDERSPRILPKEIQPVVDKRKIDIPPENSQVELPEPKKRGRLPKKPPKKFNMPDDAVTGFVKASRMNGAESNEDEDDDPATGSASKSRKKAKVKATPKKSPVDDTPVGVTPLSEVLLTPAEEKEWIERYCNVGGTATQYVSLVRPDAYPKMQSRLRTTGSLKHGRVTQSFVKAVRNFSTEFDLDPEDGRAFIEELTKDDAPLRKQQSSRSSLPAKPTLSRKDKAPQSQQSSSTTPKSRRTSTENTTPLVILDGTQRTADDDLPSLSQLQSAKNKPQQDEAEQLFYVSQKSRPVDESDEDVELPDISALIGRKAISSNEQSPVKARMGRRGAKRVVDDDDDSDI